MDAILRLRPGDDVVRGRIEPAGSQSAEEFQGWLELIAAVERLRSRSARPESKPGRHEKDT